ncbi:TniQ family protein [Gracilibacillus thailandensis]|uniref:Helix-turn-helix domain-containing protein n=1 Tax=Gracilibacillus thailandensis TaxID=563735 RepID=A0A6N7QUK7_9BACI|nr:TniQ family protein [Gracilibacillus thailandensis]MRI65753.1 helix-turn-helix domain-containing protein [Gracilibacillus thailandensis]
MNLILSSLTDEQGKVENFLSSRTELYNIKPIGIGTPYVESLSSYISRIAEDHNLAVSALLSKVIAPMLNIDYLKDQLSQGIIKDTSHFINENSPVTLEYSNALELLTSRDDLRSLTMLNWQGIFSKKLFSRYRKWCPICLNKIKSNSKIIYEPLIWYISDIKKCEVHEVVLHDKCSNCKRNLPFLHKKLMVGYCQYCGSWLGDNLVFNKKNLTEEDTFIYQNYKELLANSSKQSIYPTRVFISNFLNRLMKKLDIRSVAKLANILELNPGTVNSWVKGRRQPSSESLLKIARKIGLTIYEMIYDNNKKLVLEIKKDSYLQQQKSISISEIEDRLKKEVNSKEPKSLNRISKEYGFYIDTAKRNFPILCEKVTENFNSYKEQKVKKRRIEIEEKLKDCLSKETPISLNQFSKDNGITLKTAKTVSPNLCKKVVKRYEEYIHELKRQRVQIIKREIKEIVNTLHQKGIYPSSNKVQENLENKHLFRKEWVKQAWKEALESLGYN